MSQRTRQRIHCSCEWPWTNPSGASDGNSDRTAASHWTLSPEKLRQVQTSGALDGILRNKRPRDRQDEGTPFATPIPIDDVWQLKCGGPLHSHLAIAPKQVTDVFRNSLPNVLPYLKSWGGFPMSTIRCGSNRTHKRAKGCAILVLLLWVIGLRFRRCNLPHVVFVVCHVCESMVQNYTGLISGYYDGQMFHCRMFDESTTGVSSFWH